MSRSIFHPDSALMITLGQITDCIFLSLFWLLGCFPVVTFGAAAATLLAITRPRMSHIALESLAPSRAARSSA